MFLSGIVNASDENDTPNNNDESIQITMSQLIEHKNQIASLNEKLQTIEKIRSDQYEQIVQALQQLKNENSELKQKIELQIQHNVKLEQILQQTLLQMLQQKK